MRSWWSPALMTLVVVALLVAAALALPALLREGGAGPLDVTRPDAGDDETSPPGDHDVHLTVNASEGPLGPEPLDVDRRLFSTNLWMDNGWWPEVDPVWFAMLQEIQPGMLRWPAGHPGQHACFDPTSTSTPWPGCDGEPLNAEQLEQFVEVSRAAGAEPLVAINIKTAPPEMAAAIVHHLNVENDYNVTWFHLGNEPDLGHRPEGLNEFREAWPAFSKAMRAVDPDIKLVGPELMTAVHATGDYERQDWVRPFLEENPGDVDAISWHLYPLDSENGDPASSAYPTAENLLQWEAENWKPSGIKYIGVTQEKLRADRDALMPHAELWVTELGPDSGQVGASGITDAQVAAVWFADVLGRFAAHDTDAVFQFAYDHWSEDKDELSLVQRPPWGDYDPLPPWYTYWLYAEHWGNRVVEAESSNKEDVGVHATLREDGKLAVVMVNKDDAPVDARLTVDGFGNVARAEKYALTADSPNSLNATVNGARVDPLDVDGSTAAITPEEGPASRDTVWELEGMSVTFAVLEPE